MVGGISKALVQLGSTSLDSDEKASGEYVGSAYLYEHGAELSAKVLLALWVAGTIVPRVPQMVSAFRDKRDPQKQLELKLAENSKPVTATRVENEENFPGELT